MPDCPSCHTQNPDKARFCMACGAAFTAYCPQCSEQLPREARFCPSCGAAVSTSSPPTTEMIKLVTVLFADVVGSTAQAERMHPEDTRALMAEFFDAMSAEIRAEGGTVERIIGDAVMADFGVPVAHEDDPLRAVRAARRMLERLEKFNADRDEASQISIRIGINTGDVSTGGSFGEQLLVMGDAVNVAARLEQAAEPGTILIGERTARAVRDAFVLREVGSLSAKGKSDPLLAFVVEAEVVDSVDPAATFLIPLIGRDAELQKLEREFTGVHSDGRPRLVTVIGDPGVGKSRLTREFLTSLDESVTTMFGRCLPYGDGVTFWPLREIARHEAGLSSSDTGFDERERVNRFVSNLIAADAPHDRELVRDALFATMGFRPASESSPADPRDTFRRLLAGWRLLLSGYAERGPVVVVIEDLHWADSTMLEVLDDLVRHVTGPVLFVCPTRPDLLEARPAWIAGVKNYTSINLDPLTYDDSCRFMSLLLELDDIPEELTTRILDRAEGNPFFLEEILNHLIDEGHFALRDGRWEPVGDLSNLDIPDNVQATILARLDLLSVEERRVLQLASVVGRSFWRRLLEHLTGGVDVRPVVDTLIRRHIVVQRPSPAGDDDEEFAFKHVLTRDVVYETVPRGSRGAAHAAVALWVEEERGPQASELAELVAHHYDRAYEWLQEDGFRIKARSYFLVGSLNAVLRFAIPQAESLGQRAVDLSGEGSERVESLEALGDLYTLSSSGDQAWEAFTTALDELDPEDVKSFARIAAKAAIVATRWQPTMDQPPKPEEVRRLVTTGLSAVGEGDSADRAWLLVSNAYLQRASEKEEDEVLRDAERALEIAERLGEPELISAAVDGLSMCLLPSAYYGQIERVQRRRIDLVPRLTNVREICDAYGSAAWSSLFVGHYADAERFASAAIDRAQGIDPAEYLHGLFWRAQARFMTGDWDGALKDQAEIERIEGDGVKRAPSTFALRGYAVAMLICELRGEFDRRDAYLDLVQRLRDRAGDEGMAGALAIASRTMTHMGHPDRARHWLRLERSAYLAGQLEAACEVAADLGNMPYIAEVLSLASDEIQRGELVALRHYKERLEARVALARGDIQEATMLLSQSRDGFSRLCAPWEEAWSRLLLAETFDLVGEREPMIREAEVAIDTFRRLQSLGELNRGEKLLSS